MTRRRYCPEGVHSLFDFCPGDCGKPVQWWIRAWDQVVHVISFARRGDLHREMCSCKGRWLLP